jgi:hypothetical protein
MPALGTLFAYVKRRISATTVCESNFRKILRNKLRTISNQMYSTLACGIYEIFCEDEVYEYQEIRTSSSQNLCTSHFKKKVPPNEPKKKSSIVLRNSSSTPSNY